MPIRGRPATVHAAFGHDEAAPREWWHLSARLRANDGRDLALSLTFFRFAIGAPRVWAIERAYLVRDLTDARDFEFEDAGRSDEGDARIAAGSESVGVGRARIVSLRSGGTTRTFAVRIADASAPLRLTLRTQRAALDTMSNALFEDPAENRAMHLRSYTRLRVTGTIGLDGTPLTVSGSAWLDHADGTRALARRAEWNLLEIQLADGRDVLAYTGRLADGSTTSCAYVVDAPGTTHAIPCTSGIASAHSGPWFWRSPQTGNTYPDQFVLGYPAFGIDVTMTPVQRNQETLGEPVRWEGALDVADRVSNAPAGIAFAELMGDTR